MPGMLTHSTAQVLAASVSPHPPQRELEYLSLAGEREDYTLARALDPGAAGHPAFAGAHVLPLWPGPAAA